MGTSTPRRNLSRTRVPNVEQAWSFYDKAHGIADPLGMRPLVAHCHLRRGKLCRYTGDLAKGAEHLAMPARMYREMDMGFWLEKAEAERGRSQRNFS